MERNSQADDRGAKFLLEGQLRESFGRVVYSHKTHEKCADILLHRLAIVKTTQIILSAVTTGGLLAAVFGAGSIVAGVTAIVSTALLALNAYTKDYDLGELAQKHRQAASDLWVIRETYLSLITDLLSGLPVTEARPMRDDLLERLHGIYEGAPSTTFPAYRLAQKALQTQEELTFSEEEIDSFLPRELRRVDPGPG